MAKRLRYYLHEGQTTKFWEIQLDGKRYVLRYGKLGGTSRTVEKKFSSEIDAKEAVHSLARSKAKSGYRQLLVRGPYPQPVGAVPPWQVPASADPRRHTGARVLSAAIYREAEKQGANTEGQRPLPRSVKRCPDLVTEFYCHIVWPKRKTFRTKIDDCELDLISFDGIQRFPAADFGAAGCEEMDLFGVGSHNGGNWVLLLDGNDKRPSDPLVYEVDHSPEPGDEPRSLGRLSKFLRGLEESR